MKNLLLTVSLLLNVLFLVAGFVAVKKAGGWRFLQYKIKTRGLAATYAHRVNIFEMLPKKEGAIVFLGNSLTAQNEWAEMFGRPDILNRGIPGDHVDGIQDRLGEIASHHPAKIFLMVGINDLCFHSPEVVLEKCTNLVDTILQNIPSARLYLQSILPVNNGVAATPTNNGDIAFVNQGLLEAAQLKGLTFIDLYPLFLNEKGDLDAAYTLDGVHLDGAAYLIWKNAIEKYVEE